MKRLIINAKIKIKVIIFFCSIYLILFVIVTIKNPADMQRGIIKGERWVVNGCVPNKKMYGKIKLRKKNFTNLFLDLKIKNNPKTPNIEIKKSTLKKYKDNPGKEDINFDKRNPVPGPSCKPE